MCLDRAVRAARPVLAAPAAEPPELLTASLPRCSHCRWSWAPASWAPSLTASSARSSTLQRTVAAASSRAAWTCRRWTAATCGTLSPPPSRLVGARSGGSVTAGQRHRALGGLVVAGQFESRDGCRKARCWVAAANQGCMKLSGLQAQSVALYIIREIGALPLRLGSASLQYVVTNITLRHPPCTLLLACAGG